MPRNPGPDSCGLERGIKERGVRDRTEGIRSEKEEDIVIFTVAEGRLVQLFLKKSEGSFIVSTPYIYFMFLRFIIEKKKDQIHTSKRWFSYVP